MTSTCRSSLFRVAAGPVAVFLVLICPGGLKAQVSSALPEDVLVLARAKQKVSDDLSRLTNYVCLQTAERWSRKSTDKPYKQVDTLRFEVAQIGADELYAWPGASSFQKQLPAELAGSGFAASGSFGTHLRAAFLSGGTVTKFAGEETLNGRRALRYDYNVPSFLGAVVITLGGRSGSASSKGSFWLDPQTYAVQRLTVEAEGIPPDIPLEALVTRIDYAPVRIGSRDLWLPQSAAETMTEPSGAQLQNRIEHSQCRVFTAESAVVFEEAKGGGPAEARIEEIRLPAGIMLPVQLESEVDSAKAGVGDTLAATITADVTAGGLRIPNGTPVTGRLRMLRRETEPAPHYVIGLEFTHLEFGGKRAVFYARLKEPPVLPGLRQYFTRSSTRSATIGGGSVQTYQQQTVTTEQYRLADLPGVSTFMMTGTTFRLPKGLKMVWKTERQEIGDRR